MTALRLMSVVQQAIAASQKQTSVCDDVGVEADVFEKMAVGLQDATYISATSDLAQFSACRHCLNRPLRRVDVRSGPGQVRYVPDTLDGFACGMRDQFSSRSITRANIGGLSDPCVNRTGIVRRSSGVRRPMSLPEAPEHRGSPVPDRRGQSALRHTVRSLRSTTSLQLIGWAVIAVAPVPPTAPLREVARRTCGTAGETASRPVGDTGDIGRRGARRGRVPQERCRAGCSRW